MRVQLISAGGVKQLAAMVRDGANTNGCLAAGPAIAALAGAGGDGRLGADPTGANLPPSALLVKEQYMPVWVDVDGLAVAVTEGVHL